MKQSALLLLCAPVAWFNAKEAAPAYEFDLEKNVIRCREGGHRPDRGCLPAAQPARPQILTHRG